MICIKPTLPRADVGYFTLLNSKDLKHDAFLKEDNNILFPGTQYIAPCQGDSGSGHWISVIDQNVADSSTTTESIQNALVAVYSNNLLGGFFHNGKFEKGICGGNLALPNAPVRVNPHGIAIRTTHEKVLDFLKEKAKICKLDKDDKCIVM